MGAKHSIVPSQMYAIHNLQNLDLSKDLFELDELEKRQTLPVYSKFNEYARTFFLRLKGTEFVYYTSRSVWAHEQDASFNPVSFERVFDSTLDNPRISNQVKDSILFRLDKLKDLPDLNHLYIRELDFGNKLC